MISLWDFVSMGRFQWRGQTSLAKKLFFLLLGTPDVHTRLRNSYVLEAIERLVLHPGTRVLDGGFGRAVALFWLARHHPDWHLTGVELDPLMAGDAHRAAEGGNYRNVEILEGSVEDLAVEEAYDLVISIDIMEHIEDDVGFLRRYYAALRPGGYLVLHVPKRHQEQWRLIPAFRQHMVHSHIREKTVDGRVCEVRVHGHVRDEYTVDELQQVVTKAGFVVTSLYETIGPLGETAFELNQLFWRVRALRYSFALITFPVAVCLGYIDIRQRHRWGNSMLLTAQREE